MASLTSVVVCSYNRADSLARTLDSIGRAAEHAPPFELIVVNNNSTDHTRDVVANFAMRGALPVRYIFEGTQGLSHARNRGVAECEGEVIAFTDDDVIVTPEWLSNLVDVFDDPSVGAAGGRILPVWPSSTPAWFSEQLYGPLALLDLGTERRRLTNDYVWGANMAVRAQALREVGGFDSSLGRTAGKLYSGEETDLIDRVRATGLALEYVGDSVVYHALDERRLRRDYFRRWHRHDGELCAARQMHVPGRRLWGMPLWVIRSCVAALMRYPGERMRGQRSGFVGWLRVEWHIGYLANSLRLHGNGRTRGAR